METAPSANPEITVQLERLARAEAERDTWRAAGLQEKYLEACSLVAALAMRHTRRAAALRTSTGS